MDTNLAIQLAVVGLAISFVPAIIAAGRRHHLLAVFLVNLLVVALSLVGAAFGEDLLAELRQLKQLRQPFDPDLVWLVQAYIGFTIGLVLSWFALLIWACWRKRDRRVGAMAVVS